MVLKAEGITAGYKNTDVLRNISISIKEKSITSILGVNGAGKSTLVKALMGIIPLQNGIISYLGKRIDKYPVYKRPSLGITLCPEGRQLFPKMTVLENLELGSYHIKDKKEISNTLESVYTMLPKLKERFNQKAGTLSGGEQEMVAIGRALMGKPNLLILDEPSWGLAPKIVEEVMKIITNINNLGTTVLLIEQNANSALDISNYAYVLDVGEIVMKGSGESIKNDKQMKTIYLN